LHAVSGRLETIRRVFPVATPAGRPANPFIKGGMNKYSHGGLLFSFFHHNANAQRGVKTKHRSHVESSLVLKYLKNAAIDIASQ